MSLTLDQQADVAELAFKQVTARMSMANAAFEESFINTARGVVQSVHGVEEASDKRQLKALYSLILRMKS